MDKIIVNGIDKKNSTKGFSMSTNDKLVHQIKEQILITGTQVKQRMKEIQLELLENFHNGNGNEIDLH